MTTATSIADALRSLLPVERVAESDGRTVVSPETTEEVAAVTRYAHANGVPIEIAGAGTKSTWGNPVAADLLLDTTRVVGVRQHSWQDLTATVAAGTPWAAMQRVFAGHNQFVALDPLWPDTATVGGIVATNDSGALRLRYGSLRDLIIGMTIVLADGTIAKSGGKVVKNVAGYDLHKLMTGAFGTLGVITEVTFRLHPLPKHTRSLTVSAPQAQQLAPLMTTIRDSHLLLAAMQLRGDSYGFHLDIQLNAHPDAGQDAALRQLAQSHGYACQESTDDVWAERELLFTGEATVLKQTLAAAEICIMADHLQWASPDVEVDSVFQTYGIGLVKLTGDPKTVSDLLRAIQTNTPKSGVSTTVLCSRDSKIDRWGQPPESFRLMREIKRQFDPLRILNPGHFLGGI